MIATDSDAWCSGAQSGDQEETGTGEYAVRQHRWHGPARGSLNSRFFMDEEEKALFRSIGERLDKLDKVVAILERIEGQQIMLKKEIEQEIKEQPVVGSLASIGQRLDKLDKVVAVLERIEGRQIVVKEEIEQEIKEQPVVGSFGSREK